MSESASMLSTTTTPHKRHVDITNIATSTDSGPHKGCYSTGSQAKGK